MGWSQVLVQQSPSWTFTNVPQEGETLSLSPSPSASTSFPSVSRARRRRDSAVKKKREATKKPRRREESLQTPVCLSVTSRTANVRPAIQTRSSDYYQIPIPLTFPLSGARFHKYTNTQAGSGCTHARTQGSHNEPAWPTPHWTIYSTAIYPLALTSHHLCHGSGQRATPCLPVSLPVGLSVCPPACRSFCLPCS